MQSVESTLWTRFLKIASALSTSVFQLNSCSTLCLGSTLNISGIYIARDIVYGWCNCKAIYVFNWKNVTIRIISWPAT